MQRMERGVEIQGNIEIILLILILVLAAVSALFYYAQREPQRTNQEMPLVMPTSPPAVNKAATPQKSVKTPAPRPETKVAMQDKKKPAAVSTIPAGQKTNPGTPLTTLTPLSSENKTAAPLKTVAAPAQLPETKLAMQDKKKLAAVSTVPAPQKADTGGLTSDQRASEPFKKNTPTVTKPANTGSEGPYSLRVGSFKSKENVDRLFKKLEENGYQPSLEIVILNDNSTWYRVTAGQFKTQEEAARCARKLEDKEKIKTIIVRAK